MNHLDIQSGKVKQPFCILLYSTAGWGKSTFSSSAEKAIFLGCEETKELDIARFPIPKSFDHLLEQLDWLLKNNHDYKTLVLDSLDSIEVLIQAKVLASDPKGSKSIAASHGGFGKGFSICEQEFLTMRDKIKSLRDEKSMNVIMIAHAKKKTAIDTVLGLSFDTYETNLHDKLQSLAVDWCQACLFGAFESYEAKNTNSDKTFALGSGRRVLYTDKRPGYLAKNRLNLPHVMEANQSTGFVDFLSFYNLYESFYDSDKKITPSDLRVKILGLSENIKDDDLKKKVLSSAESAGDDTVKLERILKRINELIK